MERLASSVVAETSAAPMPTSAGVSQCAASAQNSSPSAEVIPVPRISAYEARRIGSRR